MFAFEAGRQYQAERLSRSIDEDDWDALDTRRGSTSHLSTPRQARYADATPSEKREPSYRSSRSGGDPSSSAVSRRSAPKTLFSIRNKRVEEARARAEKSSAENPASASAPETRDSYAWAREDQARISPPPPPSDAYAPITRYADAISSRDPYFDWAYDDQRVEVVNRTLETALASASAECVVEWITETAWTSGDPKECEKDVDAVMRVVATHADLSEASNVVRELIDAGGGNAARRVREWCEEHVEAPNASALAAVVDEIFGAGQPGSPGSDGPGTEPTTVYREGIACDV